MYHYEQITIYFIHHKNIILFVHFLCIYTLCLKKSSQLLTVCNFVES